MKKILGACFFMCFLFAEVTAQDNGIKFFQGSWQEAIDKSVKEDKIIFIDCNTTWCGPCKFLAKKIFPQKKLGDFFNKNFINVNMDMEKGVGPVLSKKFAVKTYPTMLFLKPGGYIIESVIGLTTADSLMIFARNAIKNRNISTLAEQFDNGPRDTALLRKYVLNMMATQSRGNADIALNTIVKQEGYEALYQQKYWDILVMAGINTPVGLWFVAHQQQFIDKYGEDAVTEKIAGMYLNMGVLGSLKNAAKSDTAIFTKFKLKMKERNLPNLPYMYSLLDFYILCKNSQVAQAMDIGNETLKRAIPYQLHQMSALADWMLVGLTEERFHAAKWAATGAWLTNDSETKKECVHIADDLLNDVTPTVYPSPKIYGVNI